MWNGYAVVDVETTGLNAKPHDRVIEIGVVQLDREGRVSGEWATLVNPVRDLGPVGIHGIRAADVRLAPAFEQIAGTISGPARGSHGGRAQPCVRRDVPGGRVRAPGRRRPGIGGKRSVHDATGL